MKVFGSKTPEMIGAIEAMFPGTLDAMAATKCPCCKSVITDFHDELSYKEYLISGMCQKCQDSVFGTGEE